jgi:hypothetical protein
VRKRTRCCLQSKRRIACWRLHYSDEITFHLDILPWVAEEESVIAAIIGFGVPRELAKRAVAITDKRHPHDALTSSNWLTSNPRRFASWVEERTWSYALPLAAVGGVEIAQLGKRCPCIRVEDTASAW